MSIIFPSSCRSIPTGALPPTPSVNDYNAKLAGTLAAMSRTNGRSPTADPERRPALRPVVSVRHANQLSPRLALVYKPFADTTLHAGYARYFTPPMQAQATPTNLALFNNTTQQPGIPLDSPVSRSGRIISTSASTRKSGQALQSAATRSEARDRSARRWTVRPGRRPDPVQLARGYSKGWNSKRLSERRLHGLWQSRGQHHAGQGRHIEPIPSRPHGNMFIY